MFECRLFDGRGVGVTAGDAARDVGAFSRVDCGGLVLGIGGVRVGVIMVVMWLYIILIFVL